MLNIVKRTGLFLFGVLLFVCAGNLQAQQAMSLDGVITQAAKDVETRLSAGAKLAVLNFTSTAEAFSDYVIEELSGALVMNRKVTVIERKSLDLIRKEMNLQLSGDVSDDSAQAIGKQLGAQAIVTGSLTNLGDLYRFRVKVINVETARIEAQFSYNLGNNHQVAFLLSGNNTPPVSSASPAVPAGSSGPAAAAQTNKAYKIGDTGPAGGLVFYDKGSYSDGWRYLEVASQDAGKAVQWGALNYNLKGTSTTVGTGKRNTASIMYYLRNSGESGRAAEIAQQYSQGGYKDFFLPSKDELNLIYTELRLNLMGDFSMGFYWSSSESSSYSATDVWVQRFSDGWQVDRESYNNNTRKERTNAVRAIRAF
ncbi:MAG: CsgG/HfaB family protein [Treponema sp.]|jgi:TolB-like protein|nr:CsgG/HfaB family protein [Treponema sp.]